MPDKVKPFKQESTPDGGQNDAGWSEVDPNEDYIAMKGIAFENSNSHLVHIIDNEITFVDPVTGQKKLSELGASSGITESQHLSLDQLVHKIIETNYFEITRDENGDISDTIYYTDDTKSLKIRECNIIRNENNDISQIIIKQYNAVGTLVQTLTGIITRDENDEILNVQWSLT